MSTAYDYWIHKQLEPGDVIITGNAKRIGPLKMPDIPKDVHFENMEYCKLTAEDKNKLSDEHLKKFGL